MYIGQGHMVEKNDKNLHSDLGQNLRKRMAWGTSPCTSYMYIYWSRATFLYFVTLAVNSIIIDPIGASLTSGTYFIWQVYRSEAKVKVIWPIENEVWQKKMLSLLFVIVHQKCIFTEIFEKNCIIFLVTLTGKTKY